MQGVPSHARTEHYIRRRTRIRIGVELDLNTHIFIRGAVATVDWNSPGWWICLVLGWLANWGPQRGSPNLSDEERKAGSKRGSER